VVLCIQRERNKFVELRNFFRL